MSDYDDERMIQYRLQEYGDKNFVKRLMYPQEYPVIERPELGPGGYSTHLMASGQRGDVHFVYPMITHDEKTNQLTWHKDHKAAQDYAIQNNEYIPFTSQEEAEWFATNYKKGFKPDHFRRR